MKAIKILKVIGLLFLFSQYVNAGSYPFGFDCPFEHIPDSNANTSVGSPFNGLFKPTRSDVDGNGELPNGFFPVLIIFVQFPNDPSIVNWPAYSPPDYLGDVISTTKNPVINGEWWNAYSPETEAFSSHYKEISRGHLDLISPDPNGVGAYYVELPYTPQEYWEKSGGDFAIAEAMINEDIWEGVKAQGLTDWRPYDRWEKVGNQYHFRDIGFSDGYVDMIHKICKSKGGFNLNGTDTVILPNHTGYAYLGWFGGEYTVDQNGTKINYGWSQIGSGATLTFAAPLWDYMAGAGHEHMHFMLTGSHNTYSRVSFGIGFEGFYSPFDMVATGYMEDKVFTFSSNPDYLLGGYASRNDDSEGNILRVPISGSNEFFILALRNKESYWDRVMLGDTTGDNYSPYALVNEYGSGLYIYHTNSGYSIANSRDMECADGYWNWELAGYHYQTVPQTCFQSAPGLWPYYLKTTPRYDNDASIIAVGTIGDGLSKGKWWGFGKKESNSCLWGTDRLWVNENEIYTSREHWGDRWDAWNLGYNEVFSPYSSPSTAKWNNEMSGIFIYYSGDNHGEAELKIWRAEEYGGNTPELDILEATPPSRPMGLEVDPEGPIINNYHRFKLTWNHNMEPDMRREEPGKELVEKRYKIYRSTAVNMNSVPPDAQFYPENHYTLIATVDIDENETPEYIDTELISGANSPPDGPCPPICWTMYPVRYRVQAVDMYDDHSVLSDFDQGRAWRIEPGGGIKFEQMPHPGEGLAGEIPSEFALNQNFPNPFNPITNIQYDLPHDVFVSIKIYDITGREITTLVNEFKEAGYYITSFDGARLSSGVYYYKIQAGDYEAVKKMILLK
jgi:hypothetical protein